MITADLTRVTSLAVRFRTAIEKCDPSRLPIGFQKFPRGSCEDVVLLLGTFLKEQGVGTFTYVVGERGKGRSWRSHAWLEADGVIVDITADQFPEIAEPVIVTTHSVWHKKFKQERPHEADHHVYEHDEYTLSVLGNAYKAILDGLDQ
jgi:hypothetical protein